MTISQQGIYSLVNALVALLALDSTVPTLAPPPLTCICGQQHVNR